MLNRLAFSVFATTPTWLLPLTVIVLGLTLSSSDDSSVVPTQIHTNQYIILQFLTMINSLLAAGDVCKRHKEPHPTNG